MDAVSVTHEGANVEIKRLLDAPPALVFEAWTKPEHLVNWWGPNGFTISNEQHEVKVGGRWSFVMHGPDGTDFPNLVLFTEVDPPRRLAYTHGTGQEGGQPDFKVVVTFEPEGNKTRLTMKLTLVSAEELERLIREHGVLEGGRQTVTRLADYLQTIQ